MLFIESYDAKSLDRSSVSMIDKYNGRLNIVGLLLTKLSSLIDNLLSLIRDVRNTLGQCKQRVYDNLNQAKEVISGNDITGTDSTVQAIEDALKAGDVAIAQAEATLQDVQQDIGCDEGALVPQTNDCGEICNEIPTEDTGCSYCMVSTSLTDEDGNVINSGLCSVCAHEGCNVNQTCNEETNTQVPIEGCSYTNITDLSCGQITNIDQSCDQITCTQTRTDAPEGCNFTCTHSSPCQELDLPNGCTHSCVDGGCNYDSSCAQCAYGTICNESCDQSEPEIEACGNCGEGYGCGDWSEFCGEVSGGSTGEGDEGCGDCGDCGNCGEGEGCGDWSEFCGE